MLVVFSHYYLGFCVGCFAPAERKPFSAHLSTWNSLPRNGRL